MKHPSRIMIAVCMMLITSYTMAQTVLTLEDCRAMALENNGQSKMAKEKVNAAEYDSKAAFANYLPKVSATGMYLHNSENINLISDEQSGTLSTIGTRVQNGVQSFITDPNIMGLITSTDPAVRNAATAMFTKMSAMDALTDTKDVIKRAILRVLSTSWDRTCRMICRLISRMSIWE